jgi:hypothetical protein
VSHIPVCRNTKKVAKSPISSLLHCQNTATYSGGLLSEIRYCEISKEMSSLYFGLAVLCLFEARVLEVDKQPLPPIKCTLYTEHCVKFWDSSFKLADYIKPKIQRRHLFADLRVSKNLWLLCSLLTI